MQFKIHYVDNTKGKPTAVKLDIEEWQRLKQYLTEVADEKHEAVDFVETPVQVKKMDIKPEKRRSFSDLLMDL